MWQIRFELRQQHEPDTFPGIVYKNKWKKKNKAGP